MQLTTHLTHGKQNNSQVFMTEHQPAFKWRYIITPPTQKTHSILKELDMHTMK